MAWKRGCPGKDLCSVQFSAKIGDMKICETCFFAHFALRFSCEMKRQKKITFYITLLHSAFSLKVSNIDKIPSLSMNVTWYPQD